MNEASKNKKGESEVKERKKNNLKLRVTFKRQKQETDEKMDEKEEVK